MLKSMMFAGQAHPKTFFSAMAIAEILQILSSWGSFEKVLHAGVTDAREGQDLLMEIGRMRRHMAALPFPTFATNFEEMLSAHEIMQGLPKPAFKAKVELRLPSPCTDCASCLSKTCIQSAISIVHLKDCIRKQ